MASKTSVVAQHILSHLTRAPRSKSQAPLFVALQGPQGSGKTHLTRSLVSVLSTHPNSLRVAVLSVDDLYLTHDRLVDLARSHPNNKLWSGRGQPGTHDVALGAEVFSRLHTINMDDASELRLPSFDKSKFTGEGDRAAEGILVRGPLDVVLLEGWCLGFYPLAAEELESRWERIRLEAHSAPDGIVARAMKDIQKEDIVVVNEALREYVKKWYHYFELFVQICPPADKSLEYIYTWRLQQERHMKAENGGYGMTDEQVHRFVDRYIPGYLFFGDGVRCGSSTEGRPEWERGGLGVIIDQKREIVEIEHF